MGASCTDALDAQDGFYGQLSINDIGGLGYVGDIAAALNSLPELDEQAPVRVLAASRQAKRQSRQYRASSEGRRYQLNVRVNGEERAAVRRYARQHRITVTDAMRAAIALLTAPQ